MILDCALGRSPSSPQKPHGNNVPLMFQVEVRSIGGFSLKTVKTIKYVTIALGFVLTSLASLIIASQPVKDFVAKLLKSWFGL